MKIKLIHFYHISFNPSFRTRSSRRSGRESGVSVRRFRSGTGGWFHNSMILRLFSSRWRKLFFCDSERKLELSSFSLFFLHFIELTYQQPCEVRLYIENPHDFQVHAIIRWSSALSGRCLGVARHLGRCPRLTSFTPSGLKNKECGNIEMCQILVSVFEACQNKQIIFPEN